MASAGTHRGRTSAPPVRRTVAGVDSERWWRVALPLGALLFIAWVLRGSPPLVLW